MKGNIGRFPHIAHTFMDLRTPLLFTSKIITNNALMRDLVMISYHICTMTDKLKKGLIQMMITALALLIGDYLMDSVRFDEPWVALITAIILGMLNSFLRPLLIVLTIPVTVFTLGLFLLVINAMMLMLTDHLVDGFHIERFTSALLLSIFISLVNAFFGAKVQVVRSGQDNHFDPHEEL